MIRVTPRQILVIVMINICLCGCAPTKYTMQYTSATALHTFPSALAREVPRYRYVGELTGEQNFQASGSEGNGAMYRALRWIAGLDKQHREPIVLQRPHSGATDAAGRIYVTDTSRRALFVFDEAGGKLEVWELAAPGTRFASPVAVALANDSQVLVTDSELARVFRISASGKPIAHFGAGVLKRPTGIAYNPQQQLVYVADTLAHDIKVFDLQGRLINTFGQRGDADGEFNYPTHLAFAKGALYVTDMMNSRVQSFSSDNEMKLKVGGRGLYIGNFVRPKGVAVDDEGNLYVIESLYDHLLVYDQTGRFLLSIGGTGQGVGQFYLPAGVWVDNRNRVFVADMFNGRVVVLQFLGGG